MLPFMLAWELGGGLGHAVRLAQIANALLERGHEVHLVWKDLSVAHEALRAAFNIEWVDPRLQPRLHLWQAPVWLPALGGVPEPVSHAEILFRAGYLDAERLLGVVYAWRELLTTIRPGLLLTDHSPTALVSSRGLTMRRATIGTGYCTPPSISPMPSFRDWEQVSNERIAAADARALATCNAVLDRLGCPASTELHQALAVDEAFVIGWPELDHLASLRRGKTVRSWGTLPAPTANAAPVWPDGTGPRVFGYLKRDHPAIDAVLACLRIGPWCSSLYVSGLTPEEAARVSSGQLQVTTQMVDLHAALADADLLLSLAGAGTVYAGLSAGVPLVMLPMQAEQLLLARRVVSAGAGVLLWPHEAADRLGQALSAVLGSPGFRAAAKALAARNGPEIYGDVLDAIVTRCEALAASQ